MKQNAPDWAAVIQQIVATGMTELEISQQPGVDVSLKAVRYLSQGRQPIFHRGDALVVIWCQRTGKTREEIPRTELVRGLRRARPTAVAAHTARMGNSLPNWLPQVMVDLSKKPEQRAPKAIPRKKAKAAA